MTDQDRAAQVWDELFAQHRYTGKDPKAFLSQKNFDLKFIATYGQERFRAGVEKMRDCAILCNDIRRFSGAVLSAQEYEKWLGGELEIMANKLIAEQEKK